MGPIMRCCSNFTQSLNLDGADFLPCGDLDGDWLFLREM